MPSPSSLPSNPDLRQLKNQAKSLLKAFRSAEPSAAVRLRKASPAMAGLMDEEIFQTKFALKDAQRTIALEHGFDTWQALANHIKSMLELSAPVEADVDPRTRRIEQLVRARFDEPARGEVCSRGRQRVARRANDERRGIYGERARFYGRGVVTPPPTERHPRCRAYASDARGDTRAH